MAKVNGWDPIEIIINDYNDEIKARKNYFFQNIWVKNNIGEQYIPKQGSVTILKSKNRAFARVVRNTLNSKN
ncbi:hypothetical protein [Spiroplasma sp. SV19]|uniref:hypothetical protein n=1 Tax=Spiroplasma sp. SV19 TaxID=2570468 RepID=UPI0024B7C5CD|nr:hypothetical protein [Spiroplasma sp. SV19]